jgi:aminoglycoside phosphotransferase (APT) family kinase protein
MSESKEDKKHEELVRRIDAEGQLLRSWQLRGGISAQMTALEMMLPDGRRQRMIVRRPRETVLKRNPQAAADEFKVLQIVQSMGVTTQAPYLLDQTGEIYATPYLVIEFIEGRPDFEPADVTETVLQMATQLARIHSVKGTDLDLSFLPKQAERLANKLKERPKTLDDSMDEGRIREALESIWPLPQPNESVLLHGDFWPGNLLWKNGQLVAVIDWEDAELGDPLADLAISRLDILMIFGVDAMNEFTRHYKSMTTIDFMNLPHWDLFAALRPVSRIAEWADGWPELGREDITEITMREGHRLFVAQAFDEPSIQRKG